MPSLRHWPALIVLCGLLLFVFLDSPLVRHAAVLGLGHCSLQQYAGAPLAPDFLAFGSSRVRHGISPEEINRASHGRLSNNYNIGRAKLSAMRDYLLLRDLVDRGVRPRVVFVELDLDALRPQSGVQPIRLPPHAAMLKYSDLGLLQQAYPDLDVSTRARLTVLEALSKVQGALAALVTGAPLRALLDEQAPAPRDCRARKPMRWGLKYWERRLGRPAADGEPPNPLETRPFQVSPDSPAARQVLFFMARIRELCRQHGIGLVVARHGAIYEPALTPSAVEEVRLLVPEFIQPPPELVRRTWAGFDDRAHMGHDARMLYSHWLTSQLLERAAP